MIHFNKPFLTGKEIEYINDAVKSGKLSGNGIYTNKCQDFLEKRYDFKKVLMTTSCTDALEMAAILCGIESGDEVIVPSYTFVSTALAFVRQGAKLVFADSSSENPNINADKIESLITDKTKVIIPVHYSGVACDMDKIMDIAQRHNLFVVEDAAQAIDSFYKGRPLGGIGHLATFSFHETKNIIAGEGGALVINDERFIKRAEIIWEKGTNRSEFFRGEVNKYGWVDTGSSFLPSELISAFLYAQLENIDKIQGRRKAIWQQYHDALVDWEGVSDRLVSLPEIPDYATNNAHMFYLICKNLDIRTKLIEHLKNSGIQAVFHYLSLHKSAYIKSTTKYTGAELTESDRYSDCLVRLPMHYELTDAEISYITETIKNFRYDI